MRSQLRAAAILWFGLGLLLQPALLWATSPRELTGSLSEENGVRVLKLHGEAFDRGHTQGFLLGTEIHEMITGVLLSPVVWQDVRQYELGVRLQVLPLFTFSADQQRELEGMLAGMREKIGPEKMRIASLNRDIDLWDLKAMNVFADVQNGGCTTFAAWGPATRDGGMVVGRNLDFNRLPGLGENQLIVVHTGLPAGRKRWVSVSWPGMIGGYTVMNEDGVLVAMHDVPAPTDLTTGPFVPRSLAIRTIAETAGSSDAVERAAAVLRETHTFCGNNFLVASPFTGQETPAAVMEYDGRQALDGGISLRTTSWKDHRLPANTIACTNHYRMRGTADQCNRYAAVRRGLLDHPTGEIDATLAQQIQAAAAVDMTLHSVVALPNQREFTVSFCTPKQNATQTTGARFTLDKLFGQ